MSEATPPLPSERAMLVRQRAKANARQDGLDWTAMSKEERKVLMEAVRVTLKAEADTGRSARIAAKP